MQSWEVSPHFKIESFQYPTKISKDFQIIDFCFYESIENEKKISHKYFIMGSPSSVVFEKLIIIKNGIRFFWFWMKIHIWYTKKCSFWTKQKNKRCHKGSYVSFLMENEFVRTLSMNENWRIALNKKSHVVSGKN